MYICMYTVVYTVFFHVKMTQSYRSCVSFEKKKCVAASSSFFCVNLHNNHFFLDWKHGGCFLYFNLCFFWCIYNIQAGISAPTEFLNRLTFMSVNRHPSQLSCTLITYLMCRHHHNIHIFLNYNIWIKYFAGLFFGGWFDDLHFFFVGLLLVIGGCFFWDVHLVVVGWSGKIVLFI